MKRLLTIGAVLMLGAATLYASGRPETVAGARAQDDVRGYGRGQVTEANETDRFSQPLGTLLTDIEASDLSTEEAEALVYMREEEKLARDVYAALYEIWNYPIFSNISRSEQQHMDSVLVLLDRYEIEDPVATDVPGVFSSTLLQTLYDDLVETGRQSLVDALAAGATIEDLDMADLLEHIEETDNEDITLVYENLLKGSRNHMRSFAGQLDRQNVAYEAQFVSDEYLESIIGSTTETSAISRAPGT